MLEGKILFNWVNPIRAGLVDRPEDYRWNSIGYHIQTGNKDNFLSLDFGLKEFGPGEIRSAVTSELHWAGVLNSEERLKGYRRYVYEAGTLDHSGKGQAPVKCAALSQVNCTGQARVIDNNIVEHEQKKKYEIKRIDRFRHRTRYFTDSGIIGTKEFVSSNYQRFKDLFMSKREKVPRRVAGLYGVYSLKRLTKG